MAVGILMLHCGLGIRNTNTFYTFRCTNAPYATVMTVFLSIGHVHIHLYIYKMS